VVAVDERALRRWCKHQLRALNLQPPLRIEVLCQRLAKRRERPIRLVAYPMPVPGPFGVWIGTGSADYIFYQSETTRLHQDHIILHEVGHIIAGHHNDDTEGNHWQQMMPDISPESIRRALQRTYYDTEQEREAEMLATMMMNIVGWSPTIDLVDHEKLDNPVVERIKATLGDR
jgi:hypothetical protein